MIQMINDRLRREDKGFTLIELMVVVLIIAILIAIAIPTFLGARRRAQDRAAQSSLRNTVTAAKAIFTDDEDYGSVTQTELQDSEPSLEFLALPGDDSTDPTMVSFEGTDANTFYAAAFSEAGKCWYVRDIVGPAGVDPATAGTRWAVEDNDDGTGCDATAAQAGTLTYVREPGDA